jgi:hypothetical protein
MKRLLTEVFLVLAIAIGAGGQANQNHGVLSISVTNVAANITVDRDCNYVVVRENSASPTAAFSITLAGTTTAINLAAGQTFTFVAQRVGGGPYKSGTVLGTIVATTSGPFSFIGVETYGNPHVIAKSSTPAASGVTSFNTRTGPVTFGASDLPNPSSSTLGGVESFAAVPHNFITDISTSGVPHAARPACADLSDSGSGCSGGSAAGIPLAVQAMNSSNAGWSNFTIWAELQGQMLSTFPTKWKAGLMFTAGTGVSLNKCRILRTAANSTTVLDSTTCTFDGGSNTHAAAFANTASATQPQFVWTDPVSMTLDAAHNYWLYFYLNADGTFNSSVGVAECASCGAVQLPSGHTSTDHTGDSTVGVANDALMVFRIDTN